MCFCFGDEWDWWQRFEGENKDGGAANFKKIRSWESGVGSQRRRMEAGACWRDWLSECWEKFGD